MPPNPIRPMSQRYVSLYHAGTAYIFYNGEDQQADEVAEIWDRNNQLDPVDWQHIFKEIRKNA